MATFLDASLLGFLQPVFLFLLVLALSYALLLKVEALGLHEKKGLALLAAVAIAALFAFLSTEASGALATMIPWIVLAFVVMFLIVAIYQFVGVDQKQLLRLTGKTPIIGIILLIVTLVLVNTFDAMLSPYGDDTVTESDGTITDGQIEVVDSTSSSVTKTPQNEVLKTLTNSKVLGAVLLLVLMAATAKFLVDKIERD
jgi:hypothetical protein